MEPVDDNNTEVTVIPFSWEVQPADFTELIPLHCWAIDRDSKPVMLRTSISMTVHIKLPRILNGRVIDWMRDYMHVIAVLKEKMGERSPICYKSVMSDKLYYYSKSKQPYINITFPNTQCVYELKTLLRSPLWIPKLKSAPILEVVEDDISPVRKLLTRIHLDPSQWFKCQAERVPVEEKISTVEQEYYIKWKDIQPISADESKEWSVHPGLGSFDIESYSANEKAMPVPESTTDIAYMITYVFQRYGLNDTRTRYSFVYVPDDDKLRPWVQEKLKATRDTKVLIYNDEIKLIKGFCQIIVETDPEIILGYNILGFDNSYLDKRLKRFSHKWPQVGRIIGECAELSTKRWSSSAYGFNEVNILKMSGRISIDMLPAIKREHKLPKYDLNTVSRHFLERGKHDVSAKDMFRIFKRLGYVLNNVIKNDIEVKTSEYEDLDKHLQLLSTFEADKAREYLSHLDQDTINKLTNACLDDYLRVLNYAVEDSELVNDLFHKLNVWISSVETSNVEGVGIMELTTRGQQIRGLYQLSKLAASKGIIIDHKHFERQEYRGAIVQHPIPGLYRNIICLDFASLYPSIIMAHNLCWTTFVNKDDWSTVPIEDCNVYKWEEDLEIEEEEDGPDDGSIMSYKKKKVKKTVHLVHEYRFVKKHIREGILPEQVRLLVNERSMVRKKMEGEKDPKVKAILNARQLAIKVSANSKYGILGAQNGGLLPLVAAAAVVTYIGRQSITQVNDYLKEKYNAKIVYGDTDSTMVDLGIKDAKECDAIGLKLADEVSELFLKPMKLEFEKAMISMLCIAPKKYAAILSNKKGYPIIFTDTYLNSRLGLYSKPRNVLAELDRCAALNESMRWNQIGASFELNRFKTLSDAIKAIKEDKPVYDYKGDQLKINDLVSDNQAELNKTNMWKRLILFTKTAKARTYEAESEIYSEIFYDCKGEYAIDPAKFLTKGIILARRDNCKRQRTVYQKLLNHILVKGLEIDDAWRHEITETTKLLQDEIDKAQKHYKEIGIKEVDIPFYPTLYREDKEDYTIDYITDWRLCVEQHNHYLIQGTNIIYDAVRDLLTRSVSYHELSFIRGYSGTYKQENYFMNIFGKELDRAGKPVFPGDRIDYLVVKCDQNKPCLEESGKEVVRSDDWYDKLGYKLRTPELYLEGLVSEYPEQIDNMYYIEKVYMNCLEQLIQVGFQEEIKLYETYYNALGRPFQKTKHRMVWSRITSKPIKRMLKYIPKYTDVVNSIPLASSKFWEAQNASTTPSTPVKTIIPPRTRVVRV